LVYDALTDHAPGETLQERLGTIVPAHCLFVPVGKRGGRESVPQAEINRLLVDYCHQGKQVVRLKSGDPFIFGRVMAEIEALRETHCPFEVIPGLSSALAAPLLAGIPLTDPVLSRGFGVFSAHEPDALNWSAIAQLDTIVLLMGGRHLGEILQKLQAHHRSPQTPIAIIRWAGQPQQEVWIGTLMNIAQKVGRSSLSPCVIVVGEVVRLREWGMGNVENGA
jgi:uroporphyrin-III C-methyltransferase